MASPGDRFVTINFRGDNSSLSRMIAQSEADLQRFASTTKGIFEAELFGSTGRYPNLLQRTLKSNLSTFDPKTGTWQTSPTARIARESMTPLRNLGTFKYTADIIRSVTNSNGELLASFSTSAKVIRGNLPLVEGLSARYADLADGLQLVRARASTVEGAIKNVDNTIRNTLYAQRRAAKDAFLAQYDIGGGQFVDPTNPGRLLTKTQFKKRREYFATLTPEGRRYLSLESMSSPRTSIDDIISSGLLGTTPEIKQRKALLNRLKREQNLEDRILKSLGRLQTGIENAYKAAPPLPTNIASIAQLSPSAYKALRKQGLGGAIGRDRNLQDIAKTMAAQGVQTSFERDETRQLTKATVAWKDLNGVVRRSTLEIDDNGKVLTRWGSQLSNINNVAKQSLRNVFKVAEWTIATTAVLGTVKALESAITTVKELDKNMRSFGITAQMSASETEKFFGKLSDVAIKTATPILELTKAADDMALATKQANQTTDEWQNSILELSNAVGILTNLSGMDTVQATDLLTSTMKQLGLTTDQLIPILNKVTAVAGGQQNAITDIARGMGVMSEAASQAGLSTDQTIATIQVLSQVTSKSAAEVATAFKNLVGSVDSRASIKALDEFNIAVRDSQGNLRNFLDVYRDIQNAIESGVIPEGRVKEVIKAISGGPRRAPDASALLANVNQIFIVEQQAVNSTNEALIANAKILDTVNAKTVKLQNTLKALFFEKFGDSIRSGFTGAIDFATTLVGLVDKIPTAFLGVAAGLTVLTGVIKAGNFGVSLFANAIRDLNNSRKLGIELDRFSISQTKLINDLTLDYANYKKLLIALKQKEKIVTIEQYVEERKLAEERSKNIQFQLFGRTAQIPKVGAQAAGFAALSGLTSLQVGSSPGEALGTSLESAGLTGVMMAQEPRMKLASVALIGLAQVVKGFGKDSKEASKDTQALSEELLTLLENSQKLEKAEEDLAKQKARLSFEINSLKSQQTLTADEQTRLNDLSKSYAEVLANAIKTGQDFKNTLIEIRQVIKELEGTEISEQTLNALATFGTNLTKEDRQKLGTILTKNLLTAKSPDIAALFKDGEAIAPIAPSATQLGKIYSESTMAFSKYATKQRYNPLTGPIDLKTLAEGRAGAENLFRLIDAGTGELRYNFDKSQETVAYFQKGLAILEQEGVGNIDKIREAVINLSKQLVVTEMDIVKASQESYITAKNIEGLEGYSAEQAAARKQNMEKYYELVNTVQESAPKGERKNIDNDILSEVAALRLLQTTLMEVDAAGNLVPKAELNINDLREVAKVIPSLSGATDTQIVQFFSTFGFAIKNADVYLKNTTKSVGDVTEAVEQLDKSLSSFTEKSVNSFNNLWQSFLQGDITLGQFNTKVSELEKNKAVFGGLLEEFEKITTSKGAGALDSILLPYIEALSKLPGFADVADKGTQGLIDSLSELLTSGKLSAKGIVLVTAAINLLKKELGDLPDLGRMSPDERQEVRDQQTDAATTFVDKVKTLFSSTDYWASAGSSLANAAKTSMLDLDKELLPKTPDVVQEIIRRAKKLQTELGLNEENKNASVAIMDGTKILAKVFGISSDILSQAMEELTDVEKKRLEQESKADSIRRIRIGSGEFAGIANVPLNRLTGASMAAEGPLNVRLDINGQILTPAQLREIANMVVASMKTRD